MVSDTVLALGALVAAEATGVTNLSGGKSDGGKGGGVIPSAPNISLPEISVNQPDIEMPEITIPETGGNTGVPDSVKSLIQNQNQTISDLTNKVNNQGDKGPSPFELWMMTRNKGDSNLDPRNWDIPDPTNQGDRNGGSPNTEGMDIGDYHLQTDPESPGWLRQGSEILARTGEAGKEGTKFTDKFMKENPYVTLGTGVGAISPDPVTTGAGFLVGSGVEIGSDTLTGGTPMGVKSPIDVTSGGAWWQGPDPLNLGNKNQDPTTESVNLGTSETGESKEKNNGANDTVSSPKLEETGISGGQRLLARRE